MRKIVLGTALLLFPVLLLAQLQISEIRFGFRLSPSISWMNTDDNKINRNGSNLGIKIATLGEYQFQENYAITAGISLAFNQGGTIRHDEGGKLLPNTDIDEVPDGELPDDLDIHYSLQYLEIPLGFKLYTNWQGDMRYYVHFPQLTMGLRTRAFADIEGGGGGNNVNLEDVNVIDDTRFLNFSYGVGAGVNILSGQTNELMFGLGYQRSFSDITKNDGRQSGGDREDSKAYFGAILFHLGMLF